MSRCVLYKDRKCEDISNVNDLGNIYVDAKLCTWLVEKRCRFYEALSESYL